MNKEELKSQALFKEIVALTKKCIPSATDKEAENLVLKVLDIVLNN